MNWYARHRYQILLAALVLLAFFDAVLAGTVVERQGPALMYALVLVAAVLATLERGRHRFVAALLAALAAGGHLEGSLQTATWASWAHYLDYCASALFLGYALRVILGSILKQDTISVDSLSGAVCGYLLLGLACGSLFALIESVWPGSFAVRPELASQLTSVHRRRAVLTYYSLVSLTTAGYGDITPLSPPARILSCAEAIAGQFYLAILVAGLVGIRISQASLVPKRQDDNGTNPTRRSPSRPL